MEKCPRCKSENTEYLGYRAQLIAIDDSVEWVEYGCLDCRYNWEA